MRKTFKWIGIALVAIIVVLFCLKQIDNARFYRGYDPSQPLNAAAEPLRKADGFQVQPFYFDGAEGDRVPALLTFPLEISGKYPCVVFLHGIGQEKEFLEEITKPFNDAGFAMASYDQYLRGERALPKGAGTVAEVLAFRRRAAKTVNDTRRLIDYLETHPNMDPDRIYLVGASYGAITGATAAAFDTRLKAVVLTYGGGDFAKILSSEMIGKSVGKWLPLVKLATSAYLGVADPVHYAGQISPRPVYLQNGRFDRIVPPAAAEALQAAVAEPKKVQWYDSDHPDEPGIVHQILGDALEWLIEQDRLIMKKSAVPATNAG